MAERGGSNDPTLAPADTSVDPAAPTMEDPSFAARYRDGAALGEGGMGEVRLIRDEWLGRDVAMKTIRAGLQEDALRGRFLREARVQGQLEHPSIVPVYDLGRDAAGRSFFTMRRVRGISLAEILERHRSGDAEAVERYGRRRLLSAFSRVCLAVGYAHAHGVVHRDLKPANVMLGDFGEVYVLDWGLAKVLGAADAPSAGPASAEQGATVAGSLFGSPGYMAPEQVDDATRVTSAADVFALGAILYEILCLEPLVTGKTLAALLESRRRIPHALETLLAMHVEPELERFCAAALESDPARRPGAAELGEKIERWLEGERDVERRRALADDQLRLAEAAAESARRGGEGALASRRTALRALGRALALDPEHAGAASAVARLVSEPPSALPEEVRAELAASDRERLRVSARQGIWAFGSLLVYPALFLWSGVRDVPSFVLLIATMIAAMALCVIGSRRPDARLMFAQGLVTLGMAAVASLVLGPMMIVPAFASGIAATYTYIIERRHRRWILLAGCASFLAPLLLEWVHLLPPSYSFAPDGLLLHPRMLNLAPTPTLVFLVLSATGTLLISTIVTGAMRDALLATEKDAFLHAWQLRQLAADAPVPDRPSRA